MKIPSFQGRTDLEVYPEWEKKIDLVMGTKMGLVLKILCKFQMGQLQDQEPRRSRKQCNDWCNPLGMKLARAQQSKWV